MVNHTNKELELAWDFVNNTNRNIFLTGKAGSGKTTFLRNLVKESLKRIVVVAPTGIAAINAKGVTIHSFFQMAFGPFLPNNTDQNNSGFNRKFGKTKINIIKSMDLLVIDEISMVRADVLDGIDQTLRRFRNKNLVFGGVQVLMIGDLQQLSPVVKDYEWQILKPYYKNIYFFSSLAYQNCKPLTVELLHIYRQDNPKFINILNQIRTNSLSQASADELNKRCLPDFTPNIDEGYISLTTHNNKAERVNALELKKLEGTSHNFKAVIDGKFPEHSFPNKTELTLKVGAQVMFIKNDSSPEKRYFNGKIGKVISLNADEVVVKCPEDDFKIIVTPEIWDNVNYNIHPETKAITENKIGSYTQIPLRLAWAITIHKSQGLTFEKAIIDAQGAFAHGQTYVALSRCKSLEGLVLKSKIESNQIITDTNVLTFTKLAEENQPNDTILHQSKSDFQLNLIAEIFNFYELLNPVNRILDIYYKNANSIEGHVDVPLNLIKTSVTNLLKVANGFNAQLNTLSETSLAPEKNQAIQSRFIKAITYFSKETDKTIVEPYKTFGFTTDSKAIEKDVTKQLDNFEELLAIKQFYFKSLTEGFNAQTVLELRAKSVFISKEKPKKSRKTVIDGTTNVELFELLRELRNAIAQREDLIHYQIFTQKSLYAMCETLPVTKSELKLVHGMGKTRIEKYGAEILDVIRTFCEDNAIEMAADHEVFQKEELISKRKKGDTKKESLALFQSGKSISDIANMRALNETTIIGHLSYFLPTGEVNITDLISEKHYKELKQLIPKHTFENLSDLKHQIDDKYTYGELRLVLNELST